MGGRRLKPQKYVLGSGYVHSDLEPVFNLLYATERETFGLTVQYGCCGGSSSIATRAKRLYGTYDEARRAKGQELI